MTQENKGENYYNHFNRYRKIFDKIKYLFTVKTSQQTRKKQITSLISQRVSSSSQRKHYITLSGKIMRFFFSFPLGNKTGMPSVITFIQHSAGNSSKFRGASEIYTKLR